MSWLDKVLAVPTVGCGFKPIAQFSTDTLASLRPLILKHNKTEAAAAIKIVDPLHVEVKTAGIIYAVSNESFSAQYHYAIDLVDRPGEIPELRPRVPIDRYTNLLENVLSAWGEMVDLLLATETRSVIRIGVVAQCKLDGQSLPPGVSAFIEHQQKPWGHRPLEKCQIHIISTIGESEVGRDRCHHILDVNVDRKNDVRLILDWQRILPEAIEFRANKLRDITQRSVPTALEYFETFGKGDLHYAETE